MKKNKKGQQKLYEGNSGIDDSERKQCPETNKDGVYYLLMTEEEKNSDSAGNKSRRGE